MQTQRAIKLMAAFVLLAVLLLAARGAPAAGLSAISIAPPLRWRPAGAAGSWQISTIPSANIQGAYTSLALDQAGQPHVTFMDATSRSVIYARWDGSAWQQQTVDTLELLGYISTSLVLDQNDRPQIAYPFNNPISLGHAAWDGAQWQLTRLNILGSLEYARIAVDGSDAPCISYYQYSYPSDPSVGARILLKCKGPSGWGTSSPVDTVHYSSMQDLARYHSLAMQSNGVPHISYYRQILSGPAQLWYATRNPSPWVKSVVDAGPGVGSYSSIALDSQGRPHISYYDSANGDLKYAAWDGSQWNLETVDSAGTVGLHTALKLDGDDRPHISYYDATNFDLKFAWWDGTQWHIETVDSIGKVGQYTSLALDADGYAHISYYDATNYKARYATNRSEFLLFLYLPAVAKE